MFALDTIERFIETWEEEERVALAADRDRRLDALKHDDDGSAGNETTLAHEMATEIEEFDFKQGAADSTYFGKQFVSEVDEEGNTVHEIKNAANDDELREIETRYKTLKVLSKRFLMLPEWSS